VSSRDLFLRVECYVSLRQALACVVTSEETLLKDFARFVEAQMVTGSIRAQIALDWACLPSPGRGLAGQTSLLRVLRGFLSHLQAAMPETEALVREWVTSGISQFPMLATVTALAYTFTRWFSPRKNSCRPSKRRLRSQ
jgi:hypothetical protein